MNFNLKKIILIFILSSQFTQSFASIETSEVPLFSSSEHVDIGDHVVLRFSSEDKGASGVRMQLENGLQLTYGEILTLGDFYGTPKSPISYGESDEEKRRLFLQAFNMLAVTPGKNEVPQVLFLIKEEQRLIEEAIRNNQSIDDVYAKISHRFDIQYNCITGGGCHEATWLLKQGRYLKLLKSNYDHFGDQAIMAYQVGHKIALEIAAKAGKSKNVNQLTTAYAMNAFASHFLTDRFSAGHIRTPRVELPMQTIPGIVGAILANYMHGEENSYGLHVHNSRGDSWIAYGDRSYLKPESVRHRALIIETAQTSANEIFHAYLSGRVDESDQELMKLIPYPDEIKNQARTDLSTLFYWEEQTKKLYRRHDVTLPYDRNWTTNWFGWTTLIKLHATRGLPSFEQAQLLESELRDEALKAGLITDPYLRASIE